LLQQVRVTIRKVTPDAEESIRYGIPIFLLKGKNLVHFAAFKNHIGFYPTPIGIKPFQQELSGYEQGKRAVQFPHDQPMPLKLIAEIATFNMQR
jgi:uncharacterized protein YdhG (YjbR/CyaY superfamily)